MSSLSTRGTALKDYLLTYLRCCYGAFIAIFIGIVATSFLQFSSQAKLIMIVGFWLVGLYYLAAIIHTYGKLVIVYSKIGLANLDRIDSEEFAKLGFPYSFLERVFGFLADRGIRKLNIKYIIAMLAYISLLIILLVSI